MNSMNFVVDLKIFKEFVKIIENMILEEIENDKMKPQPLKWS